MGTTTGIEWTDATWNPIRGCSRVSEGCRNCYAESVAYRFSGEGQPYEGLVTIGADGERKRQWNGNVLFVEKHLLDPLRWQGRTLYHPEFGDKPVGREAGKRIFVNSMSDLFHPNVKDEWIDKIFAVMALCPQHTFQVLTKRPERMLEYLADSRLFQRLIAMENAACPCGDCINLVTHAHRGRNYIGRLHLPLPNVWLGVSCEDQATADARIPLLLQTPAAVRFISAEPLLGPIDRGKCGGLPIYPERHATAVGEKSSHNPWYRDITNFAKSQRYIDWVICGGESGPGARPMRASWAQDLRDQCGATGVPFFFKQWGEWLGECQDGANLGGGRITINSSDEPIRIGKKRSGSLLDGVEWKELPGVVR